MTELAAAHECGPLAAALLDACACERCWGGDVHGGEEDDDDDEDEECGELELMVQTAAETMSADDGDEEDGINVD
jgi:hypothetical protein